MSLIFLEAVPLRLSHGYGERNGNTVPAGFTRRNKPDDERYSNKGQNNR
jgi:hypothetical protein